jgi:hypothetical protein
MLADLVDAIRYFTGGLFTPRPESNPIWRKLSDALDDQGIDPHEFISFISIVYNERRDGGYLLKRPGLLMDKQILHEFKKYRSNAPKQARLAFESEQALLESYLRHGGNPLYVLLNEALAISPLMRIEQALKTHAADPLFPLTRLLEMFWPLTEIKLIGCPWVREYYPLTTAYWLQRGVL